MTRDHDDQERWQHVNRVELTGKDGGPIRYDEAIRRVEERRAGILGGASVVRDDAGVNGAGRREVNDER
ncbi:MAG: hypothetical protein O7H41_11510 [Planctomycetota bacterium]|nr:hypothetical protein [Planctomycetota bacterium]